MENYVSYMTKSQQNIITEFIIVVHIWIFYCWVGDIFMNNKIELYTI